ncbi:MAG: hypothetical protein IT424_13590 [Pirellulales bacterium]|nr:hypothetical protein [Pirellulales bacterium]
MTRTTAIATAMLLVLYCLPAAHGSVLSNVPAGGWGETAPGGGKWDDQDVNNPGPFPNIIAALTGAGLPTDGLTRITKIDDPATSGSGLGVSFSITGQGGASGTWILNQAGLVLPAGKILAYFSLKAAQSWNLWNVGADIDLNAATYTNAWDTNSSAGGLLTPNGKNFAGLSHITFWAINAPPPPPPSTVPEPMSLAVWGLFTVSAGAVVWMRKRGASAA